VGTIVVKGLGKAYKRYPSRWSRLKEWFLPVSKPCHELVWVLRDINFTVRAGEAVGIAGVNGAGKSTLLKLITGTTAASEGGVTVNGRVSALLELGMGFHPEFTGRQNVYMACQLLGLTLPEIEVLMPKIESFAEIGSYIDQPVRTYSSGMQVRLAFSVATAHRPDILIIDEALSVGDAYFQHKSSGRIRELQDSGTTLLIVSHDRTALQSICDRVILLSAGELSIDGKPEEVMDLYHALLTERAENLVKRNVLNDGSVQTVSGSGEVSVDDVCIIARGEKSEVVHVGEPLELIVRASVNQAEQALVVGIIIKDKFGLPIYGTNTFRQKKAIEDLSVGQKLEVSFLFPANLGIGNYSVSVALTRMDSHLDKCFEWRDRALVFSVVNKDKDDFVGVTWLDADVNVRSVAAAEVSADL